MAIPKFEDMFLPFLMNVSNRKVHSIKDVRERLAKEFRLTKKDREEQVSSGSKRFDNRVAWTRSHLIKAALVESPERGKIKITKRGIELLAEKPKQINMKLLALRYAEYAEFRQQIRTSGKIIRWKRKSLQKKC